MTRYAVDEENRTLVRTWATGHGERAAIVTLLPAAAGVERHLVLADELTVLSHLLWRCYTHPPSPDSEMEVNTRDWRRQQIRDAFSTVIESVMNPNLPRDDGYLALEYDPVDESAHRVGRALHEIDDDAVRDAVRADIEAELQAVESAEQGNLAGRAGQATVLSRSDASPAQIAKADAILQDNPLDALTRLRDLEPTAAAVAAAHWLKATVDLVSKATRLPARRVLVTADDEDGTESPAAAKVLSLLESPEDVYDVVTSLVERARQVADGYFLAPGEKDTDDDEAVELTPLDLRRPAPALLDELLDSISGCAHLYVRYTEETSTENDYLDEATRLANFCKALRTEAATHRIRVF